MEKSHFIYSLPGRLLRGFLCLAAFGFGVAASVYIVYGVSVYGEDILNSNVENRYEDTPAYQREIYKQIDCLLNGSEQAMADENSVDEARLVDVSASEIYTYDLKKMYEEYARDMGIGHDISELQDYRKSYQHLDNCNMTDYNSARAFFNNDSMEDTHIYFSPADFRALFYDQGIRNTGYRFSEDFSDEAYFLFDYRGNSKTTRKVLEEIAGLKQESSYTKYDLTDITYAVYNPVEDVYYSTKDDYFEPYDSYVYSIKEVRDRLNELDADGTRFDSIVFALLQSDNKADSWIFESYNIYADILQARENLETQIPADKGQFFYVSFGSKGETNDETLLEEILVTEEKDNKLSVLRQIESVLSQKGYIYYGFLLDEKGEFIEENNGIAFANGDEVESMMSQLQGTGSKLLVYAYYNGDEYLEGNVIQTHIEEYEYYKSNIGRLIQVEIAMAILTLILAVWLMVTTGRRYRQDKEVSLNFYDKMPSEVWFIVSIVIFFLAFGVFLFGINVFAETGLIGHRMNLWIGLMVSVELFAWVIMVLVLSFCRRLKAHNFWKNSLLYYLLHMNSSKEKKMQGTSVENNLFQDGEDKLKGKAGDGLINRFVAGVKKAWNGFLKLVREVVGNMKGTIRLLIIFIIYAFINIILLACALDSGSGDGEIMLAFLLVQLAGLLCVLLLVRDTNRLIDGVSEIVKGNLDHKIEGDSRLGIYKELTYNINHIGDGLKTAIETSIKDERMKTELITNVSHDLKTPLTSIINYINLLKTEKMPTKEAEHYVEVLDGKAQRLRQLTEDLVEAAKATSGNIELNRMPLTFNELMSQSIGEFEHKFSEKELSIVTRYPENAVFIMADGRRMYRVLENVLQNVYKYAMPKTRVYIDLLEEEATIIFQVKNVSEAPLNISPEELMERFTRGDASRTSEGSGLGLSIAKDLTRLQGGTFDIMLDGDLFKVVITFPKLDKPEA